MKEMKLLEAIGGVNEHMLADTEDVYFRKTSRLLRILLVAAMIAASALSAAAVSSKYYSDNTGVPGGDSIGATVGDSTGETVGDSMEDDVVELLPVNFAERFGQINPESQTMANAASNHGYGTPVYDGDYIYFGGYGDHIRRMDLKTGEMDNIMLKERYPWMSSMFTTETHIGFINGDQVVMVKKDGSSPEVILEGRFTRAFVDDTGIYHFDGYDNLLRTDLETGEETLLLKDCHAYYVDENYIYALSGMKTFWRSSKDEINFAKFETSFHSWMFVVDGEDIYFLNYNLASRIVHYRDGVETLLPFYSQSFQVLDNKIYYIGNSLDEKYIMMSYDLSTGEKTVIRENVSSFVILGGRYIYFTHYATKNYGVGPALLDMETGEFLMESISGTGIQGK